MKPAVLLLASSLIAVARAQDLTGVINASIPLDQSFTLRYRALEAPRLKGAELEKSLAPWLKEVGKDPEDLKVWRKRLSTVRGPYLVTFSYTPTAVYWEAELQNPKDGASRHTIYFRTGKKTYHLLNRSIRISDGIDWSEAEFFPVFGPAVMGIGAVRPVKGPTPLPFDSPPVQANCLAYSKHPDKSKLAEYVPAYLSTAPYKGKETISKVNAYSKERPVNSILFEDYRDTPLGALAGKTTLRTYYVPDEQGLPSSKPERDVVYELLEAKMGGVAFRPSDLMRYTRTGESILLRNLDTGIEKSLAFDREDPEVLKLFEVEPPAKSGAWYIVGCLLGTGALVSCHHAFLKRKVR